MFGKFATFGKNFNLSRVKLKRWTVLHCFSALIWYDLLHFIILAGLALDPNRNSKQKMTRLLSSQIFYRTDEWSVTVRWTMTLTIMFLTKPIFLMNRAAFRVRENWLESKSYEVFLQQWVHTRCYVLLSRFFFNSMNSMIMIIKKVLNQVWYSNWSNSWIIFKVPY